MLLLLLACATEPPAPVSSDACSGDDTQVWVMSEISFSREVEPGISAGFDLDAAVTAAGEATGCGVPDFVDPDGTGGIDNQFARVLPIMETTEAQALEPLIQAAVEDGSLLITLEAGRLDAEVLGGAGRDDSCVDFALGRATGLPSLGTDAKLEWHQTLARDASGPRSEAGEVAIVDGRLLASGLAIILPVTVLGHELEVNVVGSSLRFDLQEDGSVRGYLGGGLATSELMAIAQTENVDPSVASLLGPLLDFNADLAPDAAGRCEQLSITLSFVAVPIFLYEAETGS